jgi:HicA toxin of bacterial toxin-antitoxin,
MKILAKAGCTFVRQGKGDHEIWYSPVSKVNFTVDSGIKRRNMANVVLKQAGLPKQF